ncbi:MAG TPA: dihydrodipicolinate synthase family protein [Acidobacteriota bacterium]|nr:dihydrodipicolinate synthase family protein [Acidobacteriota bacterium]
MLKLEGVYSVVPTPFTADLEVDYESLARVVDLFLRAGVNGMTALGVTSETARLTEQERASVLSAILKQVKGRIPVVAGTTAEGTHLCVEYSRAAETAGAAAVMVSPPRMPRLNSQAILRHYHVLAKKIAIPVVVQDYPPISGYHMEPALLVQIAREIPTARTIKLEDAPTPFKAARILEQAGDLEIRIFGGLGGVYLLEELTSGATGAMTGFAYPEILLEVVRLFHSGHVDRASDVFYRHVALMRFEFQEGIGMAIRKEMLHRRGAIAHTAVRPPGAGLDDSTRKALDQLLNWYRKAGSPWISG